MDNDRDLGASVLDVSGVPFTRGMVESIDHRVSVKCGEEYKLDAPASVSSAQPDRRHTRSRFVLVMVLLGVLGELCARLPLMEAPKHLRASVRGSSPKHKDRLRHVAMRRRHTRLAESPGTIPTGTT